MFELDHEGDAAEKMAELLRRELPGFAANIVAETDTIRVRGILKIGAETGLDMIRFPAYDDSYEAVAVEIIKKARRMAIELVGLEAEIVEREKAAEARGRRIGRSEGITEGQKIGRSAAIREFADAMRLGLDTDDIDPNDESYLDA